MSAPPAILPPDHDRGYVILAVTWAGFGISTSFVTARIFTRLHVSRNPGWDDFWLGFSVILNLIAAVANNLWVHYGLGRHVYYLTMDQITHVLYYSAIFQPIGIASFTFPKLAVMLLIIKLMGPRRAGRWFLYFIMTILFIANILCIIFIFAQCNPPNHFWHPESPAKCMSPNVLLDITRFAGSWSAFTDLSLALFPITIFWNLQIKLKKKIQVMILMGMGVFASACAIVKTTVLAADESPDPTWALYSLVIWSTIESNIVIMCASLPVLPRLLIWFKDKDLAQTSDGSRSRASSSGMGLFSRSKSSEVSQSGSSSDENVTFTQPKTYQSDITSDAAEKGEVHHNGDTKVIMKSVSYDQRVQ